MPSDPRYDRLTAESMPLEKANVETLLKDTGRHTDNQGRATKSPWRMDAPSKRVSGCPITMWIYNIAPRKHQISSLPGMPKILGACPYDDRGKPLALYGPPIPIKEISLDYASQGDYKLKAVEVDDIDLVRAIICPSCNGQGQNCKDTADLRIWGVFYSSHNPNDPVDATFQAELDTAKARLTQTMSNLVKIADGFHEDQKWRNYHLGGANGAVYRMAAKYMGIQRPWCTPLKDMETCVGCGNSNPNGAMICSNPVCGIILDYAKALKFRKITQGEYDEAFQSGLINEQGRFVTA
jgi:hypothetical protein